jgi:hypothetical protein
MAMLSWIRDRVIRGLGYFAVLRLTFVFGFLVMGLPLTAIERVGGVHVPLNSMLGNLFVDYGFGYAWAFGFALWGAVLAIMLTACLMLDIERDRQDGWIHDPDPPWDPHLGAEVSIENGYVVAPRETGAAGQRAHVCRRRVTFPLARGSTFAWFCLLGAPGVAVVIAEAQTRVAAGIGLALGALLAYICMDIVAYLMTCRDPSFRALPWPPFRGLVPPWPLLCRIPNAVEYLTLRAVKVGGTRDAIVEKDGKSRIKDDHLFAAISLVALIALYWVIYGVLKPRTGLQVSWFRIEALPPAAFVFALLLPLIWISTTLWIHWRRYRIMLLVVVAVGAGAYWLASRPALHASLGGPVHTYDVFTSEHAPLPAEKVLAPLGSSQNLIVVAASGGGILASGWTAKVLSELHARHDCFAKELRLISAVSGGSVGTAHYLAAHRPERGAAPLSREALEGVVEDAMASSLSVSAYGTAFPDFRRALFPFWVDEAFDRARLLEADWRRTANTRNGRSAEALDLLDGWGPAIVTGSRPAVILNATVMETGRRVAITPIASLRSEWAGWTHGTPGQLVPNRHYYAATLAEFLGAPENHTVDLWTAARLSATFSYVSPAARAAFARRGGDAVVERRPPAPKSAGQLHLIDGGYHDNYGIASALEWLAAALERQPRPSFTRIALVEIRARPDDIPKAVAASEWMSTWFGPAHGLTNSWGYAQTAANDSVVNQVIIRRFRDDQRAPGRALELQSFVFQPKDNGPLSWHLSKKQKDSIHANWSTDANKAVLAKFLSFVGASGASPTACSWTSSPSGPAKTTERSSKGR